MHPLQIIRQRGVIKGQPRKPSKKKRYTDWILDAQPGQRR